MKIKIKNSIRDYSEGNYHIDITEENLDKAIDEVITLFERKLGNIYKSAEILWDNVTDIADSQEFIDKLERVCRTELTCLKIL